MFGFGSAKVEALLIKLQGVGIASHQQVNFFEAKFVGNWDIQSVP